MKVKINRVRGGSMGDQRNYGLVTGSIWNYEDKATTNQVKDTLSPIPRDEATIEAEKNETVVWPDKDGNIMHTVVGGKRHSEGGTPLNVPDGSFVFSDTRALNIKNKELLKGVFGYNTNKSVTPAMVAKRYDLNRYFEILNDPNADYLDKKTAQYMIDNNLTKLGQLALVQEGMKGFPDGVPFISQPLFNKDIAVQSPAQQGPPQAKFGGQIMRRGGKVLPRHQDFGPVGPQQEYNPVVTRAVSNFEKNPSGILPYVNLPVFEVTASTPSNLLDFNEWLSTQPMGNWLMQQGYSKRDILANPGMAEKWQQAVNTNYFDKLFQANPDLKTMLRDNRLKAMQELGPEQFEMLRNSQYGFLTEPGLGSMTLQGLASMSPQNMGFSLATSGSLFGAPMSVAPGLTREEAGNYNNPLAAMSALGISSRLMQAGADQLLGTGEYGFSDALRGRPSGFGMQADIMMDPTLGLLPGLSKSSQALNLGSRIGEGAASLGRATQALRANPELGYMMSGLPLTAGDYATRGAAWGAGLAGYSTRAIPRFVYGLKGITEETPFILKGQFADEAGQPISGLLNPEGRGYTFAGKTYKAGEYPKTYGFRIPATGKNAGTPSIEQVEIPGLFDDYKGGYTKFREDLQALKKAMDEGKISPDDEIHYDVYGDVPTGDFNFSLVPGNATHKLESNDLFDAYLRLQGFQKQNTGDYKNLISGFFGDNNQFGFTKFGDFLKNAERIPVTETQMRFPQSEFVSPGRWAWRNTAGRIGMPDFTGIKPFLKHPVTRAVGKGSLYTGIGTGAALGLYKWNNRNQEGALQDDAVIHTDPRGLVPLDSSGNGQFVSPDSSSYPVAAPAATDSTVVPVTAPVTTAPVTNPPVNNAPATMSDDELRQLIMDAGYTDPAEIDSVFQEKRRSPATVITRKKRGGGSVFIYDPIENTMVEAEDSYADGGEKDLPKHQTDGSVYDISDDPYAQWINNLIAQKNLQYKLNLIRPPYAKNESAVGPQTGPDYVWGPEGTLVPQIKDASGRVTGLGDVYSSASGWKGIDSQIEYLKANGVNFGQYGTAGGDEAEGIKQYKEDIRSAKTNPSDKLKKHQAANQWVNQQVRKINTDYLLSKGFTADEIKNMPELVDPNKKGAWNYGKEIAGTQKFINLEDVSTPPPGPGPTNPPGGGGSSTTTVKKCECPDYTVDPTGNTKKEVPCNPDGSQPLCDPPKPNWQPGMNIPALWMQGDLYNFYGALGDRPYKSKGPADINANFGRVPYNLEDIARQVAGVQGAGATAMGEMTGVAANPAVLRAMQSGVAGQMGDKIADIMAQNETKNTGIINEAGKVNTEIGMKEQMYNAQNKKDYIAGVATNEQQYANEQLAMDKDVRKAFMQGDTNAMNLASANMREENYKYIPGYGSVFVPGSFTGTGSSNAFDMYDKYKGRIPDTDLLKLIEIERQQKNQPAYNPYRYNPYPGIV